MRRGKPTLRLRVQQVSLRARAKQSISEAAAAAWIASAAPRNDARQANAGEPRVLDHLRDEPHFELEAKAVDRDDSHAHDYDYGDSAFKIRPLWLLAISPALLWSRPAISLQPS
jgi:hypothetical protein